MLFTYHRVGRIPVLPALGAAGAIVIVGGIATAILAIVGVAGCAAWLLRTLRLVGRGRPPAPGGDGIIEGVVISRSSAGMLDP